ncbi:MAG TPA: CoA transferase [Jatrophihabitans sp.]|jgi:crotonobetainyl-CoA:carnitine CoA-transferase CaiB-like acyl-CoA transferase
MAALKGIRVVDLTRYLSGPTATMLLADLGADVVKIEGLPHGDPARESGPFIGDESVYYLASNRNKRSLALDLRSPEGIEICLQLIDQADVFVHNFRPGTVEKMGLGSAQLLERNPRLVYTSISGFGTRPPGDVLPGFDQTAQAMSGLMSVTGTEETGPLRVGIAIADSATGVFAAAGVTAALYERERTGRGCVVESSLMESMLSLMSYQAQKYLSLGLVPESVGNDHPIMFPQGTFQTGDGVITLACGSEKMWSRLCEALERTDLSSNERFNTNAGRMAHRSELRLILEGILGEQSADFWIPRINAYGVPCGPVLDLKQALEHPVTAALDMVVSVPHPTLGTMKLLGQGVKVGGRDEPWLHSSPPLMGQDTDVVLRELGLSDDEVSDLAARGVVRQVPRSEP